jgi:probable phosphoglycerate mutase
VEAVSEGDVVVVCHGTLLRLIACELLGIDSNEYRRAFPAIPNVGHLSLQIIESPDSQSSGLTGSLIQ